MSLKHRHANGLLIGLMMCLTVLLGLQLGCQREDLRPKQHKETCEIIRKWNQTLLNLDHHSEGQRPPVSARMFGYAGIAAYEASLPALQSSLPDYQSKFVGLQLPKWEGSTQNFVLPAAIYACYAEICSSFFPHGTKPLRDAIDAETRRFYVSQQALYKAEDILASKSYGEAVAQAVFNWSTSDAKGHLAFLYNYDPNYEPPARLGAWRVDPQDQMPALLPHWGEVRTFAVPVSAIPIAPPMPFSEHASSKMYAEAMEIFNSTATITAQNRAIAEFWSDDNPGLTFSASSRWISIANQALVTSKSDLPTHLKAYLRLGIGLNDVCVIGWNAKYSYCTERPKTYINRNFQFSWQPIHSAPSFPGYPSGHSFMAGVGAEILGDLIGRTFKMTDKSHLGRKEFVGTPRAFDSFEEMANESAYSRILMGVHYRNDCEEGLRIGNLVGKRVNQVFQ